MKQLRLKNETFFIKSCGQCLLQFGGDGHKVCTFNPMIHCNYDNIKSSSIHNDCPLEDVVGEL